MSAFKRSFKNKCDKLITMSYENSKIHVENLEKEITRKDHHCSTFTRSSENFNTMQLSSTG